MNSISMSARLARAGLGMCVVAATLTGCVTPTKPLYYWGEYQPQVYSYLKKQDSPQAQLSKLEETANKAASENLPVPPGFNAHLGLLYLQIGQGGKAQMAFQTEKARFPESAAYMDFLLKKPIVPTAATKPAATTPPKAAPAPQKGSTKK